MSKQMDQAIQSIIDLHVLIENVFTGQNAEHLQRHLHLTF